MTMRLWVLVSLAYATVVLSGVCGFVPPSLEAYPRPLLVAASASTASIAGDKTVAQPEEGLVRSGKQRRVLGAQENLMLPRQYSPNPDVTFPQMNHVSCHVLSATPSTETLRLAIDEAMAAHPLLRCHVEGDGEPEERIDLFQMVRKGDPNPCTFASSGPQEFSSKDVLTVVDVANSGREALDASWKKTFGTDIDDGSWCNVETGPLWKLEFHRHQESSDSCPCALVFSFNHAISDQSSANRLADEIVANLAALEKDGTIQEKAVPQDMPMALEDSVLGLRKRWNDVKVSGLSLGTLQYVASKAAEGFKSPVVLPDAEEDSNSALGALSIIFGKAAGGEDAGSETRKSTLQFRTLSAKATSAFLAKCRENGVAITNALTAAITLTSSDFIDSGIPKADKQRSYKVLESLDMRRFGQALDKGETVACHASSMDLIHGPISDRSGEALRSNPTVEHLSDFWALAQSGKSQTDCFISSNGPQHAVRVFDFAMTISDMNNLVYLTAQSKDSKGRAYSAGVTNVGVYERQAAFQREGEQERQPLKLQHGRFHVDDVYFGVSHARSGCLYQVSCMTMGGEMKMTFHPAMPIVSEETNSKFADAFVELLETVSSN